MKELKIYGSWAMVAGAADGLGAAFSTELAGRGYNLLLIDKNSEKLQSTVAELIKRFPVEIKTHIAELARPENLPGILKLIKEFDCRLIVYNAAYGPVKRLLSNNPEELDYYIDVNSRTPLHLIYELSKNSNNKNRTGFLLMSSLAGMWGTNLVAPYAATKAFNLNLAEGLYFELKESGMDLLASVAGATDTPNFRSTSPENGFFSPRPMAAGRVARESLEKLGKKPYHIPGFSNRLTVFLLTSILSRRRALKILNKTMRRMYPRV